MYNMREVYSALPDDRPITSLCVVEDVAKCPMNFNAVARSHDQDTDADLYKDGFFSRRITRYLCHSKIEGYAGYVVEKLVIIQEKDTVPPGFTPIIVTKDSNQRAFKKKQICFKASSRHTARQYVTDIIVLSNSKIAPPGFTSAGELNGALICYKILETSNAQIANPSLPSSLPYNVSPQGGMERNNSRHMRPAPNPPVGGYSLPQFNRSSVHSPQSPYHQSQQAATSSDTYDIINSALYAVPFQFNKKMVQLSDSPRNASPTVVRKSTQEIESQYHYNFSMEQDIMQRQT